MRGLPAILIFVIVTCGSPGPSASTPTFPPRPEVRPEPERALAAASLALFAGRPEEAYRHILLAEAGLGTNPQWLETAALVHIALGRPDKALLYLSESIGGAPGAGDRALALLQRQGENPPPASLKSYRERWRGVQAGLAKEIEQLMPAPDGTRWVMSPDDLRQISPEGEPLLQIPLGGSLDLVPGNSGRPLALGETQLFWRDTLLPIPPGVARPVSLAETPDGELILLDEREPALYRVDFSGKVTGKRALAFSKPTKVRVDATGRIFILDRSRETVHIFSAALAPLRDIDLKEGGAGIRRPENLFVDFAGDFLLFDGRGREVFLFSPEGRLLGSSSRDDARIDAAGWDGYFNLVFVDRRDGFVGRLRL